MRDMDLLTWTQRYATHKYQSPATIKGSVVCVSKNVKGIVQNILLFPSEDSSNFNIPKKESLKVNWIVLPNSKRSISDVISNWDFLVANSVRVLFVSVSTNTSWGVIPETHTRIVNSKNIEKSLLALFSQH
jgi:hypothetical protein